MKICAKVGLFGYLNQEN